MDTKRSSFLRVDVRGLGGWLHDVGRRDGVDVRCHALHCCCEHHGGARILTEQQLFSSRLMEFENKGTLYPHVSRSQEQKARKCSSQDDEFELAGAGAHVPPTPAPDNQFLHKLRPQVKKTKVGMMSLGQPLFWSRRIFLLSALLGSCHNTRRAQ